MRRNSNTETATSRATYGMSEETYAERMLREFFTPRAHRVARQADKPAAWAPAYDPLNGRIAGRRETRKEIAEAQRDR